MLLALLAASRLAPYPAHPATSPAITAADLSARDKAISDDAFQGRAPATRSGEAAATWIADEMKRIGLRPGNHGSYFQPVPAVTITLDAAKSSFGFKTPHGALSPKFGDEVVYWTPRFASNGVTLSHSPLIFVGYGVVAPEYQWDDYAGANVRGKTVVILINDPGNEDANPDPHFFKGKAMTYYGRWTYKFEEAARHKAVAAIIVHETGPAAYGWDVVRNSNSGTRSWLDASNRNASMLPIEGWITLGTARSLFHDGGLDYEKLKAAANQHGFKAVPMSGETLDVAAHSVIAHKTTRNVVGMILGTRHPADYVLYTAHWDHLGVKPGVAGPNGIYSGAVDNALGVSGILEIAEAFVHDRPPPQRSIAFICWTMEEQGLLGSLYFTEHPLWPLNHIVGGINLDANLPEGRAHDLVIVGYGSSQLEDLLAMVLRTQDRTLTPDPEPEKGHFYRSDHFSLAKVGVPMLAPSQGYDLLDGGKPAGQAVLDDYRLHRYHQPSDKWNPNWDLSGPISDLEAFYGLGKELANSDIWPNWYPGDEFRALRDKSMRERR
ncbi:MAG: M28 family peptidase [Deltaproteobacteria bacterium]|nr:M28 family peptidase [Deltaproteobacteria bacterium]